MDLYKSILQEAIAHEVSPSLCLDGEKLVKDKGYQAICEIYAVVSDDSLDDAECFRKIEEIVCILDHLGIGGGGRHDF